LQAFEHGVLSRRQLIRRLAGVAAAPVVVSSGLSAASASALAVPDAQAAAAAPFTAITVNHISYQVADYARTRDFYAGLLGMRVLNDTGTQAQLSFGTEGSCLLARNARQSGAAPKVDHIAYTIAGWDKDAVKAELDRRGLNPRPDTDLSFHVKDPDGFDVQIAGRE